MRPAREATGRPSRDKPGKPRRANTKQTGIKASPGEKPVAKKPAIQKQPTKKQSAKIQPATVQPVKNQPLIHPTGTRYLAESDQPWVSLLFLSPLILAYELYSMGIIGHRPVGTSPRTDGHITAFTLIDDVFVLLGAKGRPLPALLLVGLLIWYQIRRNKPLTIRPKTLVAMSLESILWSAPLVVLGWVLARLLPLGDGLSASNLFILSLGAGLYEEMLFRLMGVSFFLYVLHRGFGMSKLLAGTIAVTISAVLFSAYHYLSPIEHFRWRPFIFRAIAGLYLGGLYLLRGFGITVGSHAFYDIAVGLILGAVQ